MRSWFLLICSAVFLADLRGAEKSPAQPPPLGTRIADFTLSLAANGEKWSLAQDARGVKAVVVLFLGTQCPVNNLYLPTVIALHRQYSVRGVLFLGINSNLQDDAAAVVRHAKEHGLPFQILKDDQAVLADRFHAERVPEAFLLDGARTVRYRGRIDDRFGKGVKRPVAQSHDLQAAIDAVLAGKEVPHPATETVGCPISRPRRDTKPALDQKEQLTYCKHIAPIIQRNCQECHRPGEMAPFALLSYRDVQAWSEAIREAVTERRMPPWNADPAHGKFANDRRLADADRVTLLMWIDQGCIEGLAADLPPPREFVHGWGIGTPDEILILEKEFTIPAQAPRGGIPYKYRLAGRPVTEDKWLEAAEVRPGNRGVVHHVIVYLVKPGVLPLPQGGELSDDLGKKLFNDLAAYESENAEPEAIASYVPGDQVTRYPAGLARRIPKGSQLVFELHYTPNGKEARDRSAVGLVYAKSPPQFEVRSGMAFNWHFLIPPHAANHRVTASTKKFDHDIVLLSLSPHMHVRGKSFDYTLVLPDGKKEVLLSVPKYDFNWQLTYVLAEPKMLPKGSRIDCVAHFDNSSGNLNNPDPEKFVLWGDQTWEEMMIGFFEYHDKAPRSDKNGKK